MPGNRPYDAEQLNTQTRLLERGSHTMVPPLTPEQSVVHNSDFEHYPGKIEEAIVTLRGLTKVLTSEGRLERADERAARLQRSLDVAEFIGSRIVNPRTTGHANEKIGWVGTHKRGTPAVGERGFQLLDIKVSKPKPASINHLRPIRRAEHVIDKHLESKIQKSRALRRDSQWLSDSYTDSDGASTLHRGHHHLDRKERKHMRGTSRRIEKLDKKADKLETEFSYIAASRHTRGMITKWRLERAQAFPYRQQGRQERIDHTKTAVKNTVKTAAKRAAGFASINTQATKHAALYELDRLRDKRINRKATKAVRRTDHKD